MYDDDLDEALRLYEQPTAYYREVGDVRSLSLLIQNLGLAYSGAGHHERAIELLGDSVVLSRRGGRSRSPVVDHPLAGPGAARGRERGRAGARAAQGEPRPVGELGDRPGILECLESLAAVVGRGGDPVAGAGLIGAAAAARVAAGATRQPDEDAWVREVEAELRDLLGADVYAAAVRGGERLELRAAVARAAAI